jgi:hypothetical protein
VIQQERRESDFKCRAENTNNNKRHSCISGTRQPTISDFLCCTFEYQSIALQILK